jgi:hypothetical protein
MRVRCDNETLIRRQMINPEKVVVDQVFMTERESENL